MNPENHREVVLEFFRLISSGKPRDAGHLFAPDCKQHNPYLPPGMDALLSSIEEVQKTAAAGTFGNPTESSFDIHQVLADGDFVAVHTSLGPTKQGKLGGIRQIHLFRFKGDEIVEYWDVTQNLPEKSPNTDGV